MGSQGFLAYVWLRHCSQCHCAITAGVN